MASRFRHEDVSAVPSGWKVRTVTHGNHRVRVAFPPGRKVKGSGRLVSVLHPAAENPCSLRSENPAELLVLGANPPRHRQKTVTCKHCGQQYLVKPSTSEPFTCSRVDCQGKEKDLRANPAEIIIASANPPLALRNPFETVKDSKGRTWYTGITTSGHDYLAEAYPVTGKRIKRAGRPVYARGTSEGEAYDRLLEKIEPNPRLRSRGPAHANPAVETLYEEFAGQPCQYVTTDSEPHMPKGDYAQLGDPGELLSLYVKPMNGGQVLELTFKKDRPTIVTDRSARQMYFFKGNQDISESLDAFGARDYGNGIVELGEGRRIDYKARKEHVPGADHNEWKHDFGEENVSKPRVLFDTRHKKLLLEGGSYRIDGPWIRN